MTDPAGRDGAFGQALRNWRAARGLSQRELGQLAKLSQKHLSLLETGRAQPSPEVVVGLGLALQLTPHDRNLLLQAAGFAHAYRRAAASDPRMTAAIHGLRSLLSGAEQPVMAVDGTWNVLGINAAMGQLMQRVGMDKASLATRVPNEVATNLMRLLLHPAGLKPALRNWQAVATRLVGHLRRQATLTERADVAKLLREIETYPGVGGLIADGWSGDALGPLTELQFQALDGPLRFTAVCATLGASTDLSTDDLRAIHFVRSPTLA